MFKKVFLFVFIFSLFAFSLNISGNTETDKIKEFVVNKDTTDLKIVEVNDSVVNDSLVWEKAEASYYNPMQISKHGLGASGRKIRSGSIALGATFTKNFIKKEIVFIEVRDCDIVTPYGKGIFRVDDMMHRRYSSREDKYFIDFFYKDISPRQKRLGRFKIEFRILKNNRSADISADFFCNY